MSANKQYFALKASLPYLKFGESPLLSRCRFLEYCQAFLGEKELRFLQDLSFAVSGKLPLHVEAEEKFSCHETALRNALADMRVRKKGIKNRSFRREPENGSCGEDMNTLIHLLQNASNALEREKILDKARWSFLDDMEFDHYADLDALSIYCRKLLILEKWEQYRKDKAEENLENTVRTVEKTAEKI